MRFLGLTLADRVPDANFREALTRTIVEGEPAIEILFKRFDAALAQAGFLAMGGQIIDATIVAAPKQRPRRRRSRKAASPRLGKPNFAAPKQRNASAEKKAIKKGCIPKDWKEKPAKSTAE